MEEPNRIDHKPNYIESEYLPTPDEVAPRDAKGRLLPGAQLGKMKKRTYNLEELRQAINTVEKRKREKLLEHFISRAYKSDKVLIALLKKFVPDITVKDIRNTGNPFNVFITKFLTPEAKEEIIPTKYSEEEEIPAKYSEEEDNEKEGRIEETRQ